jgi:hypothetical protein
MQDLSPFLFIHTGLIIRLLRHSSGFPVEGIISEAAKLAQNLTVSGFTVSSQGITNNLKLFIDDLKKERNTKRSLTEAEVTQLSTLMDVVEQMVYAEAMTKKIYVLTEGRFNMESLINNPGRMFAKDVFIRLPAMATYDIAEGFKCIVFSRATAAAFHILRATEGTLREFYCQLVKSDRVKPLLWGNMIQDLAQKEDKNQGLLDRLDFIRSTYRNPTSHPDARFDTEQAQDLLGLCIDVINAMGTALPQSKAPEPVLSG